MVTYVVHPVVSAKSMTTERPVSVEEFTLQETPDMVVSITSFTMNLETTMHFTDEAL